MAEDKRANPYPYLTAAEFEASEGTREEKGARCIAARRFGGVPTRAFLLGDNDHSPMMKGVLEFVGAVYKLVDRIDEANLNDKPNELPTAEEWGKIIDQNAEIVAMLEDHGCSGGAPADDAEVRRDSDRPDVG